MVRCRGIGQMTIKQTGDKFAEAYHSILAQLMSGAICSDVYNLLYGAIQAAYEQEMDKHGTINK